MSRAKAQRKQIEEIVSDWQKAVQLRDIDAQQIADLSKALRCAHSLWFCDRRGPHVAQRVGTPNRSSTAQASASQRYAH